ncbi:packaged DNA stabilization protein [Symbiopectobacterium sp.]|uniref:packaged DNA stabilization protein n=1 Tax=Symbiopectobacterium sp. TaxID=2952789 RepID=UPI003F3D6889
MPIQQLPLIRGDGRNPQNLNYIDRIPVNMLAVQKPVLNAGGYLRSFPGLRRLRDSDGPSRGGMFNPHNRVVYRVMGGKVYKENTIVGTARGHGRVSMSGSGSSQGVAIDGELVLFRYDGQVKWLANWDVATGFEQYDIGSVRDICHVGGRYIWVKDGTATFGITDLEDESKPDRYRAFYSATAQSDVIEAIAEWRGSVVCFGSSSIEFFYLTGAVDASSPVYAPNASLTIPVGIAGVHCKTRFMNSYAFISGASSGPPSVWLMDIGKAQPLSTASVDAVLLGYTADELATAFMESLTFKSHVLLIIHLPRHTLVYDASVSAGGPAWSVLKSGVADDIYCGCDFMFDGERITAGDKLRGLVGVVDFSLSSLYDEMTEHILFTPLISADNARLFDLSLESSSGLSSVTGTLFVSATPDGINFGRECLVVLDKPAVYDMRVLVRRVGRVRRNIGFRLRIVSSAPVMLSGLTVRVES